MNLKIPLVLAPQPEGGYSVTSPILPELHTEGDTDDEAVLHVQDALAAVTPGMRGTARIRVGSRTVGQWLLRLVWQTFNFRM